MPEGFEDAKPWHPRCCEVPMWLIEVRKVGGVSQHVFECKVCEKRTVEPAEKAAAELSTLAEGRQLQRTSAPS